MQASKILRVAFCCPNLSIRSAKSGFMRSCQFLLLGTYFYYRARLRQRRGKRAACGFALYGECIYSRAHLRQRSGKRTVCGLRVTANIFHYRAFAARKRRTCRLRFCTLRRIFFITAHVCGKDAENVLFAVLRFKANALTARGCGKSGKRAVCGFTR